MLSYLEANPGIFAAIFVAISAATLVLFYVRGRGAEAQFPDQRDIRLKFRERGASGHSKRSVITTLGGASRVLDVVVTDRELWIKGIWPVFTYIGTKYDLTHRVPLTSIRAVTARGDRVDLLFADQTGRECHIELQLKDPEGFVSAAVPSA